jgi:hypothetical protein
MANTFKPCNKHRDLGFRCLVRRRRSSTRSRETHEHLKGIVDHPLQTSEGADHDDTTFEPQSAKSPKNSLTSIKDYSPNRETVPETRKANILVDSADSCSRALAWLALRVELRNHHIGGVRDDGAEDTGDVTG